MDAIRSRFSNNVDRPAGRRRVPGAIDRGGHTELLRSVRIREWSSYHRVGIDIVRAIQSEVGAADVQLYGPLGTVA